MNVAPLSDSARFDSAFHESVTHLQDLAKKQAGALNGVFSAGGKKYGLDSNNIYIADYKIPAALLALLPIHPSGPASQEYTTSGRQIADVNYQAGRALDAEDFKTAVKRIRQRKEREKRDKEIAAGKTPTTAVDAPVETPVHKKPMVDPIALHAAVTAREAGSGKREALTARTLRRRPGGTGSNRGPLPSRLRRSRGSRTFQ